MPIIEIPSAAEVRNGGGNSLVQHALIGIEPELCGLDKGKFVLETKELIHEMYAAEMVKEVAAPVTEILMAKGWNARVYDERGKSWLEISQPDA